MPADLRVSVRFKDQSVFAGEELNCLITFRNVAEQEEPRFPTYGNRRSSALAQLGYQAPRGDGRGPSSQDPKLAHNNVVLNGSGTRHKATGSLQHLRSPGPGSSTPVMDMSKAQTPSHKHQRSISITSGTSSTTASNSAPLFARRESGSNHRRSSTVHLSSSRPTLSFLDKITQD